MTLALFFPNKIFFVRTVIKALVPINWGDLNKACGARPISFRAVKLDSAHKNKVEGNSD